MSNGIHRALPGELVRGKMRNIYCTVAEGKKSMRVAAHTFAGLAVGNRGVPYSMLPFSVTENMREEDVKVRGGEQ